MFSKLSNIFQESTVQPWMCSQVSATYTVRPCKQDECSQLQRIICWRGLLCPLRYVGEHQRIYSRCRPCKCSTATVGREQRALDECAVPNIPASRAPGMNPLHLVRFGQPRLQDLEAPVRLTKWG
jgi:hypothetical protein